MRAIAKLLPAVLAALIAATAPASAAPIELFSGGSQRVNAVHLTTGAGGRALLTWRTGGPDGNRAFVRARSATGTLEPAQQLFAGQNVTDLPFALAGQNGDVVLGQVYSPDYSSNALLVVRGDAGESFGPPVELLRSRSYGGVSAAGNARGDVAVLVNDRTRGTVLLTAGPDGAFSAPQPLGDVRPLGEPRVAMDAHGRYVIAYGSQNQALVRRGRIGGALGAPHVLERIRGYSIFSVAIDERGTATVAYARFGVYRR